MKPPFHWRHIHWIVLLWVFLDCLIMWHWQWLDLDEGNPAYRYWVACVGLAAIMSWLFAAIYDRGWGIGALSGMGISLVLSFAANHYAAPDLWQLPYSRWAWTSNQIMTALAFLYVAVIVMSNVKWFGPSLASTLALLAFGAALTVYGLLESNLCRIFDPTPARLDGSVCSRAIDAAWDQYTLAAIASVLIVLALRKHRRRT